MDDSLKGDGGRWSSVAGLKLERVRNRIQAYLLSVTRVRMIRCVQSKLGRRMLYEWVDPTKVDGVGFSR